ncbi:nicotinamide riboside transporter PnuC [Sphingobacterium hungaricum]
MDINTILAELGSAILQTSWLERISVLCGITQVILSKNNKVSNYFFGIMGILLGSYVLFESKLYAEIVLNMYYLVMSVYGWWFWLSSKEAREQPITYSTKSEWLKVIGIVVGGFFILYFALVHYTDSDVPVWDAWVSCTAWAGMWLLAKRKMENWILLNVSNLFAIPLLIHKDLYLFAALTSFLFVMAIFGYLNWKRIVQHQKTNYA